MARLTKRFVDTVKEPGFYGDGEGLYLSVKPSGSKSYILRTVVRGKRRDIGLGSTALVSLAEAREKAFNFRKIARDGGDPLAIKVSREMTFEQAAIEYHSVISRGFKSEKHAKLWLSGLRLHVFSNLGDLMLEEITVADVRKVLEPIWYEKHETARRIKQRMHAVFDWAVAEGHASLVNPCLGIKRALRPQRRNPTHHAAMPWQELPGFYRALKKRDGIAALALRYIILTACRSGEIREASWAEIKNDVWTISSQRMKMGREHREPLAPESREVLKTVHGLGTQLIFPTNVNLRASREKPLSVNAFRPLYKRMGYDGFTTHGFRSTFRDWCSEQAGAPSEVAEAALAHVPGQIERAYRRSDLFERRRILMHNWSVFVDSASSGYAQMECSNG